MPLATCGDRRELLIGNASPLLLCAPEESEIECPKQEAESEEQIHRSRNGHFSFFRYGACPMATKQVKNPPMQTPKIARKRFEKDPVLPMASRASWVTRGYGRSMETLREEMSSRFSGGVRSGSPILASDSLVFFFPHFAPRMRVFPLKNLNNVSPHPRERILAGPTGRARVIGPDPVEHCLEDVYAEFLLLRARV